MQGSVRRIAMGSRSQPNRFRLLSCRLAVLCHSVNFWLSAAAVGDGLMRSRSLRLLLALPLLLTSFLCEVSAQTTTSGSLAGVVTDPSHAVVLDAAVEIKDNAKGTAQSTKTDREGLYRFFFLAPGRYTLTVSHDGFREERRTVDVLLGPPITVNVSLEVATANSEIRVADEVPLLQAEDGDFRLLSIGSRFRICRIPAMI